MRAHNLIFIVFCLLPFISFSQGEKNIWYFGYGAGLDFSGGAPVPLTDGQHNVLEGTACISDAAGSLLFYTDGMTVWNKSHTPMPNGNGLLGGDPGIGGSSVQAAIIVPLPGSTTSYYIFTVKSGSATEFHYSIVDLNQQGGLGDVVAKNTVLSPGSMTTEAVTAVPHANGTDFWIIHHVFGGSDFHVYHLNSLGVNTSPVVSTLGSVLSGGVSASEFIGALTASPDGSKIAMATYGNRTIELFDFDNATGILSNAIISPRAYFYAKALEFSPNGKVLYATHRIAPYSGHSRLTQFDISSNDSATIMNSAMEVGRGTGDNWSLMGMTLGPDCKIYIARYETFNPEDTLSVINDPDVVGLGCNFVERGIGLNGKFPAMGMPNFYKVTPICNAMTINISSTPTNCYGDSTGSASVLVNGGSPGYTYAWSPIGGTDSVANNLPAGTYTVIVTDQDNNSIIDSLTINAPTPISINPLSDASICLGDSATFTATASGGTPGYTYFWDGGASTSNPYTVQPGDTTSYELIVKDQNNCEERDTVKVYVVPSITAELSPDTSICAGDSVKLSASGGTNYSWNTGAGSQEITVSPTTTTSYTVTVGSGSCAPDQATVTVAISAPPTINISGDTVICLGESTTLTASGGTAYQWENGPATASIIVRPTADTVLNLQATNGNCWINKQININLKPLPTVSISGVTEICNGDQTTLTASGGTSYQWSTGDNVASTSISPTSDTTLSVLVSDGTCSTTDSVAIKVVAPPTLDAGPDQIICTGDNITLNPISDATSYQWSTGATTLSINVSPSATTTYTITVMKGTCTPAQDEVTVEVVSALVVSAGNDTTICLGDSAYLYALGGSSFLWSHGATTQASTVAPTITTTYTVTGSSGSCPDDDDEVRVNVVQATADAGMDQNITAGQSIALNGSGGTNYLWAPSTGLDDPNSANPEASPTVTTTYTLTVTDANGCTATDEVTIYIEDICGEVFVPNAFSPNGDGENDVLYVRGCLQSVHLIIFDRWGEKVFETNDQQMGWDGYYEGSKGVVAVYDYYLEATTDKGEKVIEHGTIHLIR